MTHIKNILPVEQIIFSQICNHHFLFDFGPCFPYGILYCDSADVWFSFTVNLRNVCSNTIGSILASVTSCPVFRAMFLISVYLGWIFLGALYKLLCPELSFSPRSFPSYIALFSLCTQPNLSPDLFHIFSIVSKFVPILGMDLVSNPHPARQLLWLCQIRFVPRLYPSY